MLLQDTNKLRSTPKCCFCEKIIRTFSYVIALQAMHLYAIPSTMQSALAI